MEEIVMEELNIEPKTYNPSSVDETIITGEKKIVYLRRNSDKNKEIYDSFDGYLSTYLDKLPNDYVKKYVNEVFQKLLVFIGISIGSSDGIFTKVALTNKNKLAGIVLDSNDLDIDYTKGVTDNIDNCVYAIYFGLMRSAVLCNKESIRQNKKLHKLLSTYVYLIFLRVLGRNNIYSEKQKLFIQYVCVYMFYKHYFNENQNYIFSIIRNEYSDYIPESICDEFEPLMKKTKNYESIKDIPKLFIDLNIVKENPNAVVINLIKTLKTPGFLAMIGPLDYFIGFVVLAKYSTDFYSKLSMTNESLHSAVEKIMIEYLNKLEYDLTAANYKRNTEK